jgi:hypothetical protein
MTLARMFSLPAKEYHDRILRLEGYAASQHMFELANILLRGHGAVACIGKHNVGLGIDVEVG